MEFVIISGLSGAGKSKAASFMEDMAFSVWTTCRPSSSPNLRNLAWRAAESMTGWFW